LRDIDEKQKAAVHKDRHPTSFLPEPAPRGVFCPLISVDDHVLEPPDIFSKRVPVRLRDAVPYIEYMPDGLPIWTIEGTRLGITTGNGSSGRPIAEWNNEAQKYEDFRVGVWDPKARLADMDLNGVWASVLFPSTIWGFAGTRFVRMQNKEAGLYSLRAYNDWMIEEWTAAAPDRYIPSQCAWLGDPTVAATEVRRNAERGFKAISFMENPEGLGLPSLYTEYWDPFFEACADTDSVINLHVGSRGSVTIPSDASPKEVSLALFPVNSMAALVDWIYSRVPLRFPTIRIAMSEGGVSWVPMIIERLARVHRQLDASLTWYATDPSPVDVLHRNFWFASIEDPSAFQLLDLIGEDRVMVETDYPHSDSSWPDSQALIKSSIEHLPPSTVRKICYGNASKLYRHPVPPAGFFALSEIEAKIDA
jgi:predicted TIM-barrel fold metal-dependent hydrolase